MVWFYWAIGNLTHSYILHGSLFILLCHLFISSYFLLIFSLLMIVFRASFVPCVAKPASFPFYNCTIRAGALLSYISRPCVCVRVCACVLGERERRKNQVFTETTQMHLIFISCQILQNGNRFIMSHFLLSTTSTNNTVTFPVTLRCVAEGPICSLWLAS